MRPDFSCNAALERLEQVSPVVCDVETEGLQSWWWWEGWGCDGGAGVEFVSEASE